MKATRILLPVLSLTLLLTGCDMVRSMLGKPTSEDLERLRVELEAQAQAARDSALQAEAALAAAQAQEAKPALPRYSVVVGSYLKDYNVRAMSGRMERRGEQVTVIPFRNGFTGVAVLTTDSYPEARRKQLQMIASEAVPVDTWIYDSAWGLHQL